MFYRLSSSAPVVSYEGPLCGGRWVGGWVGGQGQNVTGTADGPLCKGMCRMCLTFSCVAGVGGLACQVGAKLRNSPLLRAPRRARLEVDGSVLSWVVCPTRVPVPLPL